MKNELISIIIPVYNTPMKLIRKCLTSIENQTYKDLEVIIIDDGSSDESRKEYKSLYKEINLNIMYYEKSNTGVSDSRNYGIKKANGKYLMFVDSDDYIGSKYIEEMYNSLKNNNVKVSVSGATIVSEEDAIKERQLCNIGFNKSLKMNEYIEKFINYPYFTCVKMLIEKSIIKECFDLNLKFGEDILFAYNLLKDNNIVYIDNCEYFYVQNKNSITHNYSFDTVKKYLNDNYYVYNCILNEYQDFNKIIKIRLFTKFELGMKRLIYDDKITYSNFLKMYNEYYKEYEIKNLSYKDLYYLSKNNRIMNILLHKKMLMLYYLLNKIKKGVRKII